MKALLTASIVLFSLMTVNARDSVKSTGIGVRGCFWDAKKQSTEVIVDNHRGYSEVSTGGGGGSLFIFSRTSDNTFIEVTIAALGNAETHQVNWTHENVNVNALTLATIGLKQELFSPRNPATLRPYLTLGAGPYWIHNVDVQDVNYEEHVSVKSTSKRGGYLGGGMNFMLDDWFGINLDCRYHFVNFERHHEYSGFEYGLGVVLMWGRFYQN